MSLNIAVCIKSVPDPEKYNQIKLDPKTKTLIREGIDAVINAADLHAIELALQLKSRFGGHITLVSMGTLSAQKQLREGLSYGCDEAVLLSDRKLAGADALATAYSLSVGLRTIGVFDLILLGNASDDGATAHVPTQVGEFMGLPHLTDAAEVRMEEESSAFVCKEIGGAVYEYSIKLPAVIGVTRKINKVRRPNVPGILQAKNKPLKVLGVADLNGIDEKKIGLSGSYTKAGDYHDTAYGRTCVVIEGSDEEKAAGILSAVKAVKR